MLLHEPFDNLHVFALDGKEEGVSILHRLVADIGTLGEEVLNCLEPTLQIQTCVREFAT